MPEIRTPGPVPQDALDYWRAKDLRVGFDYRDVWGDEHAHAFTVAKMTKLDLLDDVRTSLDTALAEGQTFRQWSNEIRPAMQRKGWWGIQTRIDPKTGVAEQVQLGSPRRLKTIYRADLRSARAAGQWQRIQRTKQSQPYLVYLLGPSAEHRDEHAALQGLTLPVDDPTWSTIYPPNGYGCKCHVRQVSREARDRFVEDGVPDATAAQEMDPQTGLPTGRRVTRQVPAQTQRPDLPRKRYVNKRSGEVQYAPAGVHPAWANNSGQARVRVLREALAQRIETVDGRLARAAAADVVDSPVFDQFRRDVASHRAALEAKNRIAIDTVGELPIGVVPADLQGAIESQGRVVRISAESMVKQDRPDKHPELSRRDYLKVQQLLDTGLAVRQGNRVALFAREGDRYRAAVLKATARRDKLYLASTYITDTKAVRRAMKRAREDGAVIRSVEK